MWILEKRETVGTATVWGYYNAKGEINANKSEAKQFSTEEEAKLFNMQRLGGLWSPIKYIPAADTFKSY